MATKRDTTTATPADDELDTRLKQSAKADAADAKAGDTKPKTDPDSAADTDDEVELPVSPLADQPRADRAEPGDPAHRGGEPRKDADGSVANPPDTAPSPTPVLPGGPLRETGTAI